MLLAKSRQLEGLLHAWLAARFQGKPSPGLPILVLQLTDRCNAHCVYCSIGALANQRRSGDMPLETIAEVQRELAGLKTMIVVLFGGEPTLHPHFEEAVRLMSEAGVSLHIISNGSTMTRELAQCFARYRLQSLSFSLDSHDPATNDALRGPGSHAHVLRAVALMRDFAPQVKLSLGVTLNRHNVGGLEPLLRFAAGIGVGLVKFQPFYENMEQAWAGPLSPDRQNLLPEQRLALKPTLERVLRLERTVGVATNAALLLEMLRLKERGEGRFGCVAGQLIGFVAREGFVRGCPSHGELGNLRDARLGEIWRKGQAARLACRHCPEQATCFETTYGLLSHLTYLPVPRLAERGLDLLRYYFL